MSSVFLSAFSLQGMLMEGKNDLFSLGSSSPWTWLWLLLCSRAEGSSLLPACSWMDESTPIVLSTESSLGDSWATLGSGDGGGVGAAPVGLGDVTGLR